MKSRYVKWGVLLAALLTCMTIVIVIAASHNHKNTKNMSIEPETVTDVSDRSEADSLVIVPLIIQEDELTSYGYSNSVKLRPTGYDKKAVNYQQDIVYVYSGMSTASEPLAVLRSGNCSDVVSMSGEWAKLSVGEVEGYALKSSLLFSGAAYTYAVDHGEIRAYIDGETDVYAEGSKDSLVIGHFDDGDNVYYITGDETYTRVAAGNVEGFVPNSKVRFDYILSEGITYEAYNAALAAAEEAKIMEEEAKRKAAEEEAAAAALRAKEGIDKYVPTVQRDSISLSDDDLWLLACIVKYESGWQPYEGKLAVANVVLNRMNKFGQSISEVIYAPNQFSGVSDGNGNPSDYFYNNYLTQDLSYRLTEAHANECMEAAIAAASGTNNIGDFLFFIGTAYADYARYSDYKTIEGHVFYNY